VSAPNPFKYCPQCKSPQISFENKKHLFCNHCGYEYYHNTAAAVAGFLEYEGKVLVVERNREPGSGMLDLPGGFVDPMESGEEALLREIKEELGIQLVEPKLLFTVPNQYQYKGIDYYTLDIFFSAQLDTNKFIVEPNEIRSYKFLYSSDLKEEEFCFASMKEAIKIYKSNN
jgi:NADH pyrophosphatase NudC (nudix superfamily)